ncbi:MAG: hypothetical protein ACOYOB_04820 [Myxococcota bacterium]
MKSLMNRMMSAAALTAALALVGAPALAQKPAAKKAAATKDAKKEAAKPAETAPAPAAAAAPAPAPEKPKVDLTKVEITKDELLASHTVAVQPMLMAGGNTGAWTVLASQMASAKTNAKSIDLAKTAKIKAPEGPLGFAGNAEAKDVAVLQYAVALGFLPTLLNGGNDAAAKELATNLMNGFDALSGLSADTQTTAKLFIALALRDEKMDGELLGMVYAAAMKAGMLGIAAGPQRAHGYYLAGIWTGMALMVGSAGGSATYADMAEPICVLLDEDAAFGGTDRKIATLMRAIAVELKKDAPDMGVIKSSAEQVLSAKSDV